MERRDARRAVVLRDDLLPPPLDPIVVVVGRWGRTPFAFDRKDGKDARPSWRSGPTALRRPSSTHFFFRRLLISSLSDMSLCNVEMAQFNRANLKVRPYISSFLIAGEICPFSARIFYNIIVPAKKNRSLVPIPKFARRLKLECRPSRNVRLGVDPVRGREGHRGIGLVGYATSQGSDEIPLQSSHREGYQSGDRGRHSRESHVSRLDLVPRYCRSFACLPDSSQ